MNTEVKKSEVVVADVKPTKQIVVVQDPIHILDTGRFEHLQRIATVMARCNLIPDGLCTTGTGDAREYLPEHTVIANCFLVVNQAVRWGMDPFAVTQCVSVVHGRLCYEGKLIAAVLEAKLGLQLEYEISGQGDAMAIVVSGAVDGRPVVDSQGRLKTVTGSVADWKTTNSGSPWAARGGHPRMLRYRGAREWARVYAPGLMLGVYSDDEMADLSDDARANRARNVTPIDEARQARQERPKPPDPNAPTKPPTPPDPTTSAPAAPTTAAGPRPPDPAAAAEAKPDTGRLEANMITQIRQLESPKDCAIWLRDSRAMRASLPAEAQARVEEAFYKHQEGLPR